MRMDGFKFHLIQTSELKKIENFICLKNLNITNQELTFESEHSHSYSKDISMDQVQIVSPLTSQQAEKVERGFVFLI